MPSGKISQLSEEQESNNKRQAVSSGKSKDQPSNSYTVPVSVAHSNDLPLHSAANAEDEASKTTDTPLPLEQSNSLASSRIYIPLSQLHAIRLVTIKHDPDSDPIRCELHTTNLNECGLEYDALSYCWGSHEDRCEILLNCEVFLVTRSLFEALDRIRRSSSKDRVMWIDALCINQADLDERSSQVRQMHKVYGQATTTLIWLGPGNERSDFLMEILPQFLRSDRRSSNRDPEGVFERDDNLVQFTDGLKELWDCEYWTRVWVVQEIHSSKDHLIEVLWGTKNADYKCLKEICYCFMTFLNPIMKKIPRALQTHGRLAELSGLQECFLYEGPSSMLCLDFDFERSDAEDSGVRLKLEPDGIIEFFTKIRNKKCGDPKDYVFGS
jgi:Heterokaryon incompatibility protein (HET)